MAIDVYFAQDIAHILTAVYAANGGATALMAGEVAQMESGGQVCAADLTEHMRIYRQGFNDALNAVAMAFGIGGKHGSDIHCGVDHDCVGMHRVCRERMATIQG